MARRVFFSFHYENDVNRAMIVRNSWVTQGKEAAGFIDKAEFEKVKLKGAKAIEDWIDSQLCDPPGTTVTVVLIGEETLSRHYVQYEIIKSLNKGNAIIGVHIHNVADMHTRLGSAKGNPHTVVGERKWTTHKEDIYFDDIAHSIHDYSNDNGYANLGNWIEAAAKSKGK